MALQLLWIGLGNMGRGMCNNLVEKGNLGKPLLVFNRSKQRADDMVQKLGGDKVKAMASIEEGVKHADIIFSCLSNDSAVKETFGTIVKAGDVKGKTFIECSTVSPGTAEEMGKLITDAGAEFVACPVFGSPPFADAGKLIFVPAGPKAAIDKLRPYIMNVMGRAEIPLEDKPYGSSLKLKLVGNTMIVNMVTQLAESYTLSEKAGIDPATTKLFVDTMFGGVYSAYSDRMLKGTYWKMEEPLFSADNTMKDINHALDVASEAGVELKNTKISLGYIKAVADHAGGDRGDLAGMYGAVRKSSGLKFENDV